MVCFISSLAIEKSIHSSHVLEQGRTKQKYSQQPRIKTGVYKVKEYPQQPRIRTEVYKVKVFTAGTH
jgi:hypothetical protein